MALLRKYEGTMAWVSADEQDNNCIIFHYQTTPTQGQIDTDYDAYVIAHQYDNDHSVEMDLKSDRELLIEMLKYIRERPALTLAQFNTALASKIWNQQYTAKYFLWKLAVGLSQYYDVSIEGQTESQIFIKIRNWLVNNPIKKIAKVVFNEVFDF